MSILELLASIPSVGSLKIADTIIRELAGRGFVIVSEDQTEFARLQREAKILGDPRVLVSSPVYDPTKPSLYKFTPATGAIELVSEPIPFAPQGHVD